MIGRPTIPVPVGYEVGTTDSATVRPISAAPDLPPASTADPGMGRAGSPRDRAEASPGSLRCGMLPKCLIRFALLHSRSGCAALSSWPRRLPAARGSKSAETNLRSSRTTSLHGWCRARRPGGSPGHGTTGPHETAAGTAGCAGWTAAIGILVKRLATSAVLGRPAKWSAGKRTRSATGVPHAPSGPAGAGPSARPSNAR